MAGAGAVVRAISPSVTKRVGPVRARAPVACLHILSLRSLLERIRCAAAATASADGLRSPGLLLVPLVQVGRGRRGRVVGFVASSGSAVHHDFRI